MLLDLFLPDNPDVIVCIELCITYFLFEVVSAVIDVHCISLEQESVVDLLSKLLGLIAHRNQSNLPWRDPEIPLSSRVLAQYGDEPFQRSEYRPMDDHWPSKPIPHITQLIVT